MSHYSNQKDAPWIELRRAAGYSVVFSKKPEENVFVAVSVSQSMKGTKRMSNGKIHIEYPDLDEGHEESFLESVLDKDELNCETPAKNQVTQTTKRSRKQERK